MLIRFIEVGRDKKTWESEIPSIGNSLDERSMVKSIKKHGALMSRYIDIEDDGSIIVGVRTVGRWEPVEPKESTHAPQDQATTSQPTSFHEAGSEPTRR